MTAPVPPAKPPAGATTTIVNTGSGVPWWLSLLAGVLLGGAGAWALWHPRAVVVDTKKPALVQKDSSVVLARRPDSTVKIAHMLPQGAKATREVHLAIQPPPVVRPDTFVVPAVPASPGVAAVPAHELVKMETTPVPVVHVDLTVVRNKDGTESVVASSPDGRVLSQLSVDVPIGAQAVAPRQLRWVAGALYAPTGSTFGAFVGRDVFGPVHLSVALSQVRLTTAAGVPVSGAQVQLGVGIRF